MGGIYKTLLQELVHRQKFAHPSYDTESRGKPHECIFLSTVVIGIKKFRGQEAKTKKQAEFNAAEVAYHALIKAKLSELNKKKRKSEEPENENKELEDLEAPGSENEEQEDLEALPVGEVIMVSGKGRGKRNHYGSFQLKGHQYELEDSVLLVSEECFPKPHVAIIKGIVETRNGAMMLTAQWLYRPEEVEKRVGEELQSSCTRELFYSFHRDEVPAKSVMHKCAVHFIPLNKQIPHRKQHPGFIVQKVYDHEQMRLFNYDYYEDNKQEEIILLVWKTLSRLGELPHIESEDAYEKRRGIRGGRTN